MPDSLNIEINTSSPITTVHAPEILKREENGLIKKQSKKGKKLEEEVYQVFLKVD